MAREPGDGEETGAKRVLETGIALVHEGELVFPAAGAKRKPSSWPKTRAR